RSTGHFIGNARITLIGEDDSWDLSAFVQNLTNTRNIAFGFDLSSACGCSETSYGAPRWWGLQLRYRFN
ncbi:MAG: hypothetical protein JJU27_19770, partial [Gammaproteobacteria bacterium]|nr:hypothetical protein [Gammaproteobacteria bacterium]